MTSREPARYLATALGSIRYPVTQARCGRCGESRARSRRASLSVKEGGDQVEYEDQDPRIHAIWLEEMHKRGLTPAMDKYIKG